MACISLIASMAIYVIFRSTFKHADYNSKQAKPANVHEEELTPAQTKERIVALLLVFAVVILTVPVQDRQGQIDFRRYCYLGSCGFRSQLWYYGPYIAYPSSDFPTV